MNVHPGLTTHPKFRMFRQALGRLDALEYLLRLWGHCQTMQRGEDWGKVTAGYVEAICLWEGEPGVLFKTLQEPFCGKDGWLKVDGRGNLTICGWNEHNARLVTNWRVGPTGGRPKQTQGKPKDNPRVSTGLTQGKPKGEPIGEDWRGLDGIGLDGTGWEKSSLSLPQADSTGESPDKKSAANAEEGKKERNDSLAEWPTREEWLAFCGQIGLPEWKAEREWLNQERKHPKWKGIGNWQSHAAYVRTLWEGDGRPGPAGQGQGASLRDKKAPSRSSELYALREEEEALCAAIAEHAANDDSTAFNPGHSGEEAEDLQLKKARLREIEAQKVGKNQT